MEFEKEEGVIFIAGLIQSHCRIQLKKKKRVRSYFTNHHVSVAYVIKIHAAIPTLTIEVRGPRLASPFFKKKKKALCMFFFTF